MSYKIKELVNEILYLLIAEEQVNPSQISYYCNNEFDSNVSTFEALNNARQLGVVSKLSLTDSKVLSVLLSHIVQENYFSFNNDEILYDFICDEPIASKFDKDKEKLYKYNCPKLWLKYLRVSCNCSQGSTYEHMPGVDERYIRNGFENFQQTFLSINEINVNLRITRDKIVQIEN